MTREQLQAALTALNNLANFAEIHSNPHPLLDKYLADARGAAAQIEAEIAFNPPQTLPTGQELVGPGHAGARGGRPSWIYTCVGNHARTTALTQDEIEALVKNA